MSPDAHSNLSAFSFGTDAYAAGLVIWELFWAAAGGGQLPESVYEGVCANSYKFDQAAAELSERTEGKSDAYMTPGLLKLVQMLVGAGCPADQRDDYCRKVIYVISHVQFMDAVLCLSCLIGGRSCGWCALQYRTPMQPFECCGWHSML